MSQNKVPSLWNLPQTLDWTVDSLDHYYDGRYVIAGRTKFITHQSTVTLKFHYFDLLWTCRATCSYSCAAVDRILTDTVRRVVRLR